MSNQNEFQYLEAKEFLLLPIIELSDVKSFTRFANANNIQYIFKITNGEHIEFFFPYNNIVYKLAGNGFETLQDMQLAQSGNFADAKSYYEAKKVNISSHEQYLDYSRTGSYNKEEYDAAVKAGFKEGFEKFKSKYEQYKNGKHTSVISDDIDSPARLYKYASQKGIKDYKDFEKIYDTGFPDMLSFNDAELRGFKNATAYFDAKNRGFTEAKDYHEAVKLQIEFKKEYDEYKHLDGESQHRNLSFDQLQLLIALSNRESGHISVAEARKMLINEQEKLKKDAGIAEKQYLPLWYKRSIDQDAELIKFLKTSKDLRMFGFFNTEKNSFEIFKASSRKILIDGSNVAHNSKSVPEIKNIRAVIKELQFYKFKDITIIVDASLRHKIKAPIQLEELKQEYNCHETPKNTSADQFLIDAAKKEMCKIVTNDNFDEWRKNDPWVRDKIDDLLVKFRVIKDDIAVIKDIEKLIEKPVTLH